MSDSNRKVFPVESVLALVVGKEGADVKELAGYVVGRSIVCDCCAKAVAPFAATWLARWYPRFLDLEWSEGQDWDAFVEQGRKTLGDNISLTAMDGRTKALAAQVLDYLAESYKSLAGQTSACMELEKRVQEMQPYQAQAEALQKKVDELEAKIKGLNADMGGLRRQVAEYQGKVAVSHDDLMQTIKDAIKDGLKGMVVGGAAAGAAAAAEGEAAPAEENSVPDDFGFGASGANSDGFGF
ncbi:MAG: hypothetical protein Q4F27_04330 [Desulfovibrionaceae bacterium]|nr:hypothetical protein [Desulfovibrionaceae bacterium]